MGGVTCTRDDYDVRSQRAHLSYDFVDHGRRGNRHDHGSRMFKAATLKKFRVRCVTIIDVTPATSMAWNDRGVIVNGDITKAMPIEHRADNLSNPSVSYDDCMICTAARCDRKFVVTTGH